MSDWTRVASVAEFKRDEVRVVDVDNLMVAVYNLDGEYIAIEDVCPHDGSEIASGCVKNGILECPRHGATFDLRSGDVLTPPAYDPLEMMQLRVENGFVEVRDGRWD
ncbi:MAG: non-heme iron oxygenase ferredoxin subunit [Proteobacteria bacterium]|nr:non-heme iron oxygenase ferredoxin subunit [Pseudomonadota bacterium]